MENQIKILFLASNPSNAARLRLDEEVRVVDRSLRAGRYRDRFDLIQHWAVRASDLQEIFLRHEPDIVHFSGHGTTAGQIVLHDDYGRSQVAPPAALSNLFSFFASTIRCVVLNACYTADQALAIARHIDCVVGMSAALNDRSAESFAGAFYQALAYGKSVQTAFDLGCNQIALVNLPEPDVPKLLALRGNAGQLAFAEAADGKTLQTPAADAPVFDQRNQQVTSQVNIHTLHVTMLRDLDPVDSATKQQLRSLYESRARNSPHKASYHLTLGLYYVDCGMYSFAVSSLLAAHQIAPMDSNILYYLALATLAGQPPRSLTMGEVQTVETYLNVAIKGSGNHAHYFYLWALVKYDYYTANGLRVPPPSIDDLLAQAGRAAFDASEARHLLAHVPVYDNPVVQRIRSRR